MVSLLPALLHSHQMLIGIRNTFFPDIVNVADKSLFLEIFAAKFLCNPVKLVQLLLIVPRHGNGLLLSVQYDTHC